MDAERLVNATLPIVQPTEGRFDDVVAFALGTITVTSRRVYSRCIPDRLFRIVPDTKIPVDGSLILQRSVLACNAAKRPIDCLPSL